jgi:ribosomal protein L32
MKNCKYCGETIDSGTLCSRCGELDKRIQLDLELAEKLVHFYKRKCQLCKMRTAVWDSPTLGGQWAFVCNSCYSGSKLATRLETPVVRRRQVIGKVPGKITKVGLSSYTMQCPCGIQRKLEPDAESFQCECGRTVCLTR